jgi:hypothetical protein
MNNLLQHLEKETNYTFTENGAKTPESTLSSLIDFFGQGGAMRDRSENDIISLFSKAFAEDRLLALKCLFYLRSPRDGMGERRTFRVILKWLGKHYPSVVLQNLYLISEFGRWDDLYVLENTPVWGSVLDLIKSEWNRMFANQTLSLFAKWCPSINTSSSETRRLAKIICKHLGLTEKQYRKTLAKYREKLRVVEAQMCSKLWDQIDYSKVPSKASLLYKDAFNKHDTERYCQFIKDVKSGKTKINASVTYPYEVVEKILYQNDESDTLDAIWNSLPNYLKENPHNGIVIADTSGSMYGRPMAVSISLALYFAERNQGAFSNYFMTFSETPKLQKVLGNNIREKILNLSQADWDMSTNLQSVFEVLLNTAVQNQVPSSEMPEVIYIVSDMEFNQACENNKQTNFERIQTLYKESGYVCPSLVFWNVNAKNFISPITKNDEGTCLVSGCSPVILKTLLQGKVISAYEVMMAVLNSEPYQKISLPSFKNEEFFEKGIPLY